MKKSLISSLIAACLGCALASPLPADAADKPVVRTSALGVQLSTVSRRRGITFCSDVSTAFRRAASWFRRPCGLQSNTSSPVSSRKPFSSV